jgi:serine protease Do
MPVIVVDEAILEKLREAADRATGGVLSAAAPKPARDEAGAKEASAAEARALRGVVAIERAGQPVGLGTVLQGDGRVVTALSPLASGNDLTVRYADGSTARAKVGHHDRMWDLALLVPQTGKWAEGIAASSRDPLDAEGALRTFSIARGKVAPSTLALRSRKSLIGGDDRVVKNALELGSRVAPTDLGAPILDSDGRVVGMLGRGCAPNEGKPCTPVAFGVPVSAIKAFLRTVPASAVAPAAWLGIQGVPEVGSVAKGVRILTVHPESPAEAAQLKGGERAGADTIVAVDGAPVTSPEALAEAIRRRAVGEKVPVLLFGQGKFRTVNVELRAAPDGQPEAAAAPANPAELPPLEEPRGRRKAAPPLPELP